MNIESVNGRLSTCKRNRVLNNILVRSPNGVWFIDDDNISDRNIFVDCGPPFDFAAWQKKGFDKRGLAAKINVAFDVEKLALAWSTAEKLPLLERLEPCGYDFCDSPWKTDKVPAGPFPYPGAVPATIALADF